jgi:heme/copper-type cytochrome/quinol oxidase subunit 1
MNGNTSITATVAHLLTPAERQHWKLAWLSTVDHKRIGILYMLTGLVFFVIAGIEALLIRLQLMVPNNTLLGPDTYNWMFTMHGTTMIFLVAMPVLFGIMNYILPERAGCVARTVRRHPVALQFSRRWSASGGLVRVHAAQ